MFSNKYKNLIAVNLPDNIFTEEDEAAIIGGDLGSTPLLLGTYSKNDIEQYLLQFGILEVLNKEGFKKLEYIIDTSDPFVHKLRVTDQSIINKPAESNFLVSMFLRRKKFVLNDFKEVTASYNVWESNNSEGVSKYGSDREIHDFMGKYLDKDELHLTVIEWMTMQNPTKLFDSSWRPQLPGQKHPGLRVGKQMANLLIWLSEKKGRDGLLNIPEHFHNALIYYWRGYKFVNPGFQAYFEGIAYDLEADIVQKGLAAVSWAFYFQNVIDKETGKSEKWSPQEQIYPTKQRLKEYFNSKEYKHFAQSRKTTARYYIDWDSAETAKRFIVGTNRNI